MKKKLKPDFKKSKTTGKGTKIKNIKRLAPKKDFTFEKDCTIDKKIL
jgi:hypothetical protein